MNPFCLVSTGQTGYSTSSNSCLDPTLSFQLRQHWESFWMWLVTWERYTQNPISMLLVFQLRSSHERLTMNSLYVMNPFSRSWYASRRIGWSLSNMLWPQTTERQQVQVRARDHIKRCEKRILNINESKRVFWAWKLGTELLRVVLPRQYTSNTKVANKRYEGYIRVKHKGYKDTFT